MIKYLVSSVFKPETVWLINGHTYLTFPSDICVSQSRHAVVTRLSATLKLQCISSSSSGSTAGGFIIICYYHAITMTMYIPFSAISAVHV